MNGSRVRASVGASHPATAVRYELRERIASGGMGVIYRAHDTLAERDVAFKRLSVTKESHRAQVTALFEREYHTLVQLAHPGIVEVYEYGIDELGPYYTMELLSGANLSAGMPLPVGQACKLLCEVSSALALVHTRRLVHRDLSPANVLLTNSGRAKLIDFGALTSFGRPKHVVGTPGFVAPECLKECDIDQRADLYALGALAYWTLTGKRAVHASNLHDLVEAWTQEIVPPSEFVPDIPKALEELVLSLLQENPLARPASAAYVIDRLSSIANLPPEEDEQRVAYSYIAHPPLVERTDAIREIENLAEESADGRGSAVWIEAGQGLGRTALLAQVSLQAQLTGATVLHAQGRVQGSALLLARSLVGAALRMHSDLRENCETHDPNMTAFCLTDGAAWRRQAPTIQMPAAAAEGYAELLSSMQRCLLRLCRQNPLVLMVDDVQRADVESIAFLTALAHEVPNHALLLITSSASDELESASPALSKLSQISRHVELSALSEPGIKELIAAIFGTVPNSTRLARWLYAQASGNPQRTLDLLRLLLQRGIVRYRAGLFSLPYEVSAELAPDELVRVPMARFEGISVRAQKLAQLLSIEQEALSLSVLSEALDLQGRRLMAVIDEIVERGIAAKVDGRIAISSRTLRSAASSTLTPELEQSLHQELARALLARSVSADERILAGFHLLRAGLRNEGADTLAGAAVEIAFRSEGIAKAVPALEQALEVYRAQGRPDVDCMRILVPLTVAGFYGDPRLSVRYLERTYQALLHLSGTNLAARLRRFLGPWLSLLVGLAYSYLLFLKAPRDVRIPLFRQVLLALFGVASAGAAAMTCAYEQEQTVSIGRRLAPFSVLGPNSAASLVRELCQGLADIMLSVQADCAARMQRLVQHLSRPGGVSGLDEEVRMQLLLGAMYIQGISEVYAGNPLVLKLANQLEQGGRAFSKPRAALIRMCHYGFRGEQATADAHRVTAEVLALLGGTSWSAMSAMAIRQLLMYQWTRDSVGLLRVASELESLSAIAPALDTHRELAQASLELLRDRPEHALAIYERVLRATRPHAVVNWQSEAALHAQALNALGRHAEARDVCNEVVTQTRDIDRRMRFLYQPALQELAISEALLGQTAVAANRLDRLIDELNGLDNPLLSGSAHRDRCRVALLARDSSAFELHLSKMGEYFRATRNPCLIQQCDRLALDGIGARLRGVNADAHSSFVRRLSPSLSDETADTTMIETPGGTGETTNADITQPLSSDADQPA